jgi:hypothetical protein
VFHANVRLMQHDDIDSGEGADCIVLAGTGTTTVEGGSGGDRVIRVPPGTNSAEIERIFAHCGGPSDVKKPQLPAWAANLPPVEQAIPVPSVSPPAKPSLPSASFSVDGEVIGILCATLIIVAFFASRVTR